MNADTLKKKADELFYWFEENKFEHSYGLYSRDLSLVCEFEDWFKELSDSDIADTLGLVDGDDNDDRIISSFRSLVLKGIDAWYGKGAKSVFAI